MTSSQKVYPSGIHNLRTVSLLLSACFFTLCAYVNINDPDPSFWVSIYLSGAAICFASIGEMLPAFICEMFALYCMWIIYGLYDEMINSNAYQNIFHSHVNSWEFFEIEQGREIGGLVYLIFGLLLSRLSPKSQSSFVKSLYFIGCGAMAGGIWATWYVQPDMNKTNFVEHCSGSL